MVFDPWFDDRIERCESRTVNGLTNEQTEGIARRLLNYFKGIDDNGYALRTETSPGLNVTFSVVRHGLLSRKKVMEVSHSLSDNGSAGYVTEFRIYPAALHDAVHDAKKETDTLIREYSGGN